MSERINTEQKELDDLFERFRVAPKGHVFAPLADACRKAGMIEEALEICARGVALHPRYASGHVVQGKCLYDAGRGTDAEAAFRRVLDLDPNNLVALKFLGIIHAERGEGARARDYFEHILRLDPDNRDIHGRIEEVRDAPLVDARELAPAEPARDEAPRDLEDIPDEEFVGEPITLRDETVTSDEIATITLADIYASQGYRPKALKIYHEVLRRQPGNASLERKIASLEELERQARTLAAAAPAAASVPAATPEAPGPTPARQSDRPAHDAAPGRAAAPHAPPGAPINEARSYEQFKRWLKAMSD